MSGFSPFSPWATVFCADDFSFRVACLSDDRRQVFVCNHQTEEQLSLTCSGESSITIEHVVFDPTGRHLFVRMSNGQQYKCRVTINTVTAQLLRPGARFPRMPTSKWHGTANGMARMGMSGRALVLQELFAEPVDSVKQVERSLGRRLPAVLWPIVQSFLEHTS